MKAILTNFILSVILIASFGLFERALACSCDNNNSPCEEAGSSSAVFVGKAVGAKEQKSSPVYDTKAGEFTGFETYDVGEIYFEVQEAFAGVKKGSRVTIHSGTSGGDCGYWFKRGESYLIYASGESKRFYTSICRKTRPVSEADEDLTALRGLARGKRGAKITGIFAEVAGLGNYDFDKELAPLAGINLLIQPVSPKGRVFKATTDFEGKYEITGVPAGKYKVDLPLLKDTKFTERTRLEIETTGFGCVRQIAVVENKNEIGGKVVDAMGKPVEDVTVELISSDNDFSVPASKMPYQLFDLKADGKFTFSSVPAGRYFLSVRYVFRPSEDLDYPVTFYPNGKTPASATPVIIGRTDKINNIVFQLPPKIAARKVRGTVTWSDGKPVNTLIDLYDVEYGKESSFESSNENGEFVLNGFDGRRYQVIVRERISIGDEVRNLITKSPVFILDENTQPFKLILDKPKDLKDESEKIEDKNSFN